MRRRSQNKQRCERKEKGRGCGEGGGEDGGGEGVPAKMDDRGRSGGSERGVTSGKQSGRREHCRAVNETQRRRDGEPGVGLRLYQPTQLVRTEQKLQSGGGGTSSGCGEMETRAGGHTHRVIGSLVRFIARDPCTSVQHGKDASARPIATLLVRACTHESGR